MASPMFTPRAAPSDAATPGASEANTSASAPWKRSRTAARSRLPRSESRSFAGATPRRARSGASDGSNSTSGAPPPGSAACALRASASGSCANSREAAPCCEACSDTATSPGSVLAVYRRGIALPAGAQPTKSCAPSRLRAAARPWSRASLCSGCRAPASAMEAAGSRVRANRPYPRTTETATRVPPRSKRVADCDCPSAREKPPRSTRSRCIVCRNRSGLLTGRAAISSARGCASKKATAAARSGSKPAEISPSRASGSNPSCAAATRRASPSCSPPGSDEARSMSAARCWATAPSGAVTTAPPGCAGKSSSAAFAVVVPPQREQPATARRSSAQPYEHIGRALMAGAGECPRSNIAAKPHLSVRQRLGSPARTHHALEPRIPAHGPQVDALERGDPEKQRTGKRQRGRRHHADAEPDQVRLHQERVLDVAVVHRRLRLHALAASQRLLPFRRGRRRLQPHLLLELLEQLVGADFLRLLLDLHPLRVDVRHRHVHARFVDGRALLDLLQHLVVRGIDASDLEALHRVRHLALPLGPAGVAERPHGVLRLAVLLAHEGLFHLHGLVERLPRRHQLLLVAVERRLHRLELRGIGGGDVVAIGLDGGLHLGGQLGDVVPVLLVLLIEQRDVRLHHGDRLVHLRDLVVQIADVLLEDQLGIFGRGDHPAEHRAKRALHALPHSEASRGSAPQSMAWD